MIAGAPWWVAADVCRAMALQVAPSGAVNVTSACRPLDPFEQMLLSKQQCGARRSMIGISESGLYKLVMRSDKPEARAFQDWVNREVLPAIRKDGATSRAKRRPPSKALLPGDAERVLTTREFSL